MFRIIMAKYLGKNLFLGALMGAMLTQASPVIAQYVYSLRNSGLTAADIDMAMEAAASLYRNPGVKSGDRAEWSNPPTMAGGTVTVDAVEAAPVCVLMTHVINGPRIGEKTFSVKRCRNENGEWMIFE